MLWQRYRLRRFGRGGFVRTALRAGVPIVPIALVGGEEAMPIFAHMRTLQRISGLIYFPLNHAFPHFGLAAGAMYLPAKFKIHFLEPIDLSAYPPETVDDAAEVQAIAEGIRGRIQSELDAMLAARKSVWIGLSATIRRHPPGCGLDLPAMRRGGAFASVAVLAAGGVAGCGSDDHPNDPRPPAPIEVTARVDDEKVAVQPAKFGAGLVVMTISNQSGDPSRSGSKDPPAAPARRSRRASPATSSSTSSRANTSSAPARSPAPATPCSRSAPSGPAPRTTCCCRRRG